MNDTLKAGIEALDESFDSLNATVDAAIVRHREALGILRDAVIAWRDLGEAQPSDARCRDCTDGTTPTSWKPRPCWYHAALRLLGVA